jgi:DNA repair exonuclease SbcCD ATPase subunit
MGEENPQVSPKAAYNRAVRAEEKAENALNEIASLKRSIDELVRTLKGAPSQPIQAQSLRPGQMIHTIISEDDEGITEEIVCPTCGTRELRKIPTKVEVKEKPVVPENYIPAPHSVSEAISLLESLHLPDGRTIFESDKFWSKLNEYAQKYVQNQKKR